MKLWEKNTKLKKEIEDFTVGNDTLLDQTLLPYDCEASIAHAGMLNKIGVLSNNEFIKLKKCLKEMKEKSLIGEFEIKKEDEDGHTAIENYLIHKLGDVGKKIHTGRSRNDQVQVALRLYFKEKLNELLELCSSYGIEIQDKIKKYGKIKIPGYTHMQKAMPSSIGLWLGSFNDAMKDNKQHIENVLDLLDQNPLGSGAGFGIPVISIDKEFTATKLGFSKVQENSLYVQLSRGKFEGMIIAALDMIMLDINKLASDLMLFTMPQFQYFSLPDGFCTGSSIMPQKKNYDVLELMRGKYHILLGYEMQIKGVIGNLISGYNRDVQLTKEPIMKSFELVISSVLVMNMIIKNLIIHKENCENQLTDELYATEKAYTLVLEGKSFRDAYKEMK
tara:strand:+ start:505 stop:1674 length:1170 start_codon:yes stop_codon:yes gene_type:complete